jgi:hypothetical protein
VAIDLFLVWAVRSRRDVALAVAVAVSANVAGVLSAEPLGAVDTWVSAALHAVFPLTVWRMHRTPQTAVSGPGSGEPDPAPREAEIAAPAPAGSPRDSWPPDDLWADFADSAPGSVTTPPKPEDVRAVIAEIEARDGRTATGQSLATHYKVSERTGRRYLRMAEEVTA